MTVKRIVANIAADDLSAASLFYSDILAMNLVMDLGWIQTFAGDSEARPQISIASEGGGGTPVPDLSIEVDNLDEVYALFEKSNFPIEYPLTAESWGVRRFYVRDPFDRLINILSHD